MTLLLLGLVLLAPCCHSIIMSSAAAAPPLARRDKDRVVYAGKARPGWNFPTQSDTSTETLLDPAVPIPDPYGWMRDETRQEAAVLQHLKAENAYTEASLEHLQGLRETLYQEMLAAIRETDYTVPRPFKNYYYYSRTFEGKAYPRYCRAKRNRNSSLDVQWDGSADTVIVEGEETTLDVNELAKDHDYCDVEGVEDSPSQNLLAYSVDYTGGEKFSLFVKDLTSGEIIDHDPDLETDGSIEWGKDDKTLFYLKVDEAMRPFQVYRRILGSSDNDKTDDELLFQEDDETFWVAIGKSDDEKYLFVATESVETSEVHYLDLHNPHSKLQCAAKRRPKVLYCVEHQKGNWWIQSNVGGLPNLALWKCAATSHCQNSWELARDEHGKPLFDGGHATSLTDMSMFAHHVVLVGRTRGLPRIWFARLNDDDSTGSSNNVTYFSMLDFPEEAYGVAEGNNYEYETDRVAIAYDSLVTPTQMLDINLNDPSDRKVLKERQVPGYDKSIYGCERVIVLARDGKTEIPLSLVYRKDAFQQHEETGQPLPLLLYGYGAYGSCEEATFSSTTLTLLNRGVVYAIAHVRGGGEMGRQWYEEPDGAKYLCKKNSFNDFVDVAVWLVQQRKLTSPDLLACMGASAGGLLIGASINQAPDLFKAAILDVPFVDVMATMLDASLPLAINEWEEWGNPNEKKYFQYMMEYSPMQNVKKTKYPACLITGGLHDPRVQYWEPAKLAATLRHEQDPKSGPVYLKIDMTSGHFSASDRYKYLKETAFHYSFILDQLLAATDEICSTEEE